MITHAITNKSEVRFMANTFSPQPRISREVHQSEGVQLRPFSAQAGLAKTHQLRSDL
jgi:hypothetical protein